MLKRDEALGLLRSIAGYAKADIAETWIGNNLAVSVTLGPDIELVPPTPADSIPSPAQRYRVLHVEDIGRTADLVYYYLRSQYDVDTIATAEEAYKAALETHYDFILVDLSLGEGMNGLELTQLFRQTPEYATTPIIAVTGFATREDVTRSAAAGCSAFLSKPFLKSDLLKVLQQLEERLIRVNQAAGAAPQNDAQVTT